MLSTLNRRMGVLFLAVIALVTVSAVATMASVESQKTDALIINLAGRQRMLIQGMTGIAFQIGLEGKEAKTGELLDLMETFDRTQEALLRGGLAPYLPGQDVELPQAETEPLIAQLSETKQAWLAFRNHLNIAANSDPLSSEFASALDSIESTSPLILQSADESVRLFEALSVEKVSSLRVIQTTFFFSMALLLALGFVMTRKSMLLPIQTLASEAEKIRRGTSSTSIQISGPHEVTSLADSINSLRMRLSESQEEMEERIQERTHELAALHEVSSEITSRLDIHHVLRSVSDRARELLNCETAFLCLLNDAGDELNMKAMSGPKSVLEGHQLQAQDTNVQLVIAEREAVAWNCDSNCALIAGPHQRSHLAASLIVSGQSIGALCAASPKSNHFSDKDAELLTKLANSAAIAIENARAYADAERVAALEERNRIGAEIHDGLAQVMSYLELEIQDMVEKLDAQDKNMRDDLQALHASVRQASHEVRKSISSLSDPLNAPRSLQAQLEQAIAELNSNGGTPIQFSAAQSPATILSIDEIEHILRIIKEAILNARRHAQASNVNVTFGTDDKRHLLTIEDDGRGFDPRGATKDERGHYGLSIMRARANRLHGELTVQSNIGRGTKIVLNWPANMRTLANSRSRSEA